ncbi:hypothetical protein CMUS01_05448 [Colletotrichum musicola]|uniref:Uncharacterized protein n=1 Tax=Colletotrichum musicola TaxID=2175873 RepID=A0A8H6NL17_9PEZI|nr:hypothetical protein CMUS01_05448 [Colletotrichum musicola]
MVMCSQLDLEETRHLAIDESVLGDGINDRAVLCLAESILRQLPLRVPGLRRLDFIRRQADAVEVNPGDHSRARNSRPGLREVIEAAVMKVSGDFPEWRVPKWEIRTMQLNA